MEEADTGGMREQLFEEHGENRVELTLKNITVSLVAE